MKFAVIPLLLLFPLWLYGETSCDKAVEKAETLIQKENFDESEDFLLSVLPEMKREERVEILWRLSKVAVLQGEYLNYLNAPKKNRGDLFEKAFTYADRAVKTAERYNVGSADYAYFYRAYANGRLTEIYRNITALTKIKAMREDILKAIEIDPLNPQFFIFLGGLYANIPGPPLSFGNEAFGVSVYRYSIDLCNIVGIRDGISLEEAKVSLAEILLRRDWSLEKRNEEFPKMERKYQREKNLITKICYYEGDLNLPPVSDREEAKMWANDVYDDLLNVKEKNFKTRAYFQRVADLMRELE